MRFAIVESGGKQYRAIEGRTIEGQGPDTVSSLMAITPRAVRMLLANARRTLQSDPAIRAIWFGET